MPDSIQNFLNNQIGIANTQTAHASAPKPEGAYRGERVIQPDDPLSMLKDAAEELTFAASEKMEKSLAKRKAKGKDLSTIEQIAKAQQYLQKIRSMENAEKLAAFLQSLKKQAFLTAKQLLERTKQTFKDVSDQYAALMFVQEALEEEGGFAELQGALNEAMVEAMNENGSAIRAGLNIAATAASYRELGDLNGLREFYRQTILGYETLSDTYGAIIEKHGEQHFTEALSFLLKALGDDFSAKGPSIPPVELKSVIDDMYRLEVLSGLHEDCGELVRRIRQRAVLKEGYADHWLMRTVLKLKSEKWLRSNQVIALGQDMGLRDITAEIYFLRELRELVRLIPLKAYEDPANREKLMDAVQEALDDAINREENL